MRRPPIPKMPPCSLSRIGRPVRLLRYSPHCGLVNASSNPRPQTSSSSSLPSSPSTKHLHTTTPYLFDMKLKQSGLPKKNEKITPSPFYLADNPPPYCHTCARIMKPHPPEAEGDERKYCCGGCRRKRPRRHDMEIEETFANFLNDSTRDAKLVSCDEVELHLFGDMKDTVRAEGDKTPLGKIRATQRELVRRAARRGVIFGLTKYNGLAKWPKCEAVQNGRVVEPSFAKGDFGIRWRE